MINSYFQKTKEKIEQFSHIILDYNTHEKIYSNERGFISGKINFSDDSSLDFAEVKDNEISTKIKNRYHYMNPSNELEFRYDNSKHYPDIETFPHHKHTKYGVEPCNEPEINDVLKEIEPKVSRNN